MQIGDVDPALAMAETHQVLGELLHRLPPRDQAIIRMRFIEDLTQSDIAARIGISQMQVSRILGRALAQLREWGSELS